MISAVFHVAVFYPLWAEQTHDTHTHFSPAKLSAQMQWYDMSNAGQRQGSRKIHVHRYVSTLEAGQEENHGSSPPLPPKVSREPLPPDWHAPVCGWLLHECSGTLRFYHLLRQTMQLPFM